MGSERCRYSTRRPRPASAVTSAASSSSTKCFATPCRVIDSRADSSVAVPGPCSARAARMARRVGSASAAKTPAATSSASGRIEIRGQLPELGSPPLRVAVVGLLQPLVGELREAALVDDEASATGGGLEHELDI